MPAFTNVSETGLLSRYLQKDHRFRQGQIRFPSRAVLQDNIGWQPMAAWAEPRVPRWFGPSSTNLIAGDAFTNGTATAAIWGLQAGKGGHDAINNDLPWFRHTTSDMATMDPEPAVAFWLLLGSYFCTWNLEDNFLRACVALPNSGVGALWLGGALDLDCLAMGECLAQGLVRSVYAARGGASVRTTYIIGDPTLRMQITPPPTNFSAATNGTAVMLSWQLPDEPNAGVFVYRSTNTNLTSFTDFTRLTGAPLTGTNFTDAAAPAGAKTYLLRTLQLYATGAGSFTNLSQGVMVRLP